LGNVIYVLPPYCSMVKQLEILYDAIDEAADIPGG
jgi:adenosylmethionine-8-amino-7-oxononanoate aminotransferase